MSLEAFELALKLLGLEAVAWTSFDQSVLDLSEVKDWNAVQRVFIMHESSKHTLCVLEPDESGKLYVDWQQVLEEVTNYLP